ncbi:hypothetical protein [Bacteroides pyogenes]|uniref:Uncharacterized protein n=1 Tax=Bacteroides pyogenes TaxID=310300 RepID=A0A5D3EL27_9BACE|nr:hypothetical protein [Bacteroides pyogenes]TYK35715.1 hypothetical protein FNJ60_01020 [Bacteroides pyogenes]TYK51901.1 hypothetical protein FNG97_02190 [Bacteroides pyogenes]
MSYDISGSALSFLLFFHELERIPQTLNLNTAGFKKKGGGLRIQTRRTLNEMCCCSVNVPYNNLLHGSPFEAKFSAPAPSHRVAVEKAFSSDFE